MMVVGIFVCAAGPSSLYLTLDLVWKCVSQPTLDISCLRVSCVSCCPVFSLHVNIARNNLRDNITPELTTRKLSLHKHPVSQLDSSVLGARALIQLVFYRDLITLFMLV